jgi:hypothetical protein
MNNYLKSAPPSPWIWLGIPFLIIAMMIGFELTLTGHDLSAMYSENGPLELLQFGFMVLASFLAARLVFEADDKLMKLWALALFAGSIYIAGEEVSWGQWLVGWGTPEFWASFNDQNETNLHNTSAWFDQKPRLILFIGMVVGGLIIPALRRWKPSVLPQRYADFYPGDYMAVTTIGVLVPYTIQKIGEELYGVSFFERVSEIQEAYIYFFILLYISGLRKLKKSQA